MLQSKANDGEGPELLRSVHDGSTSSHAESLATTLAEHRQHLDSIQVDFLLLGNQCSCFCARVSRFLVNCSLKLTSTKLILETFRLNSIIRTGGGAK